MNQTQKLLHTLSSKPGGLWLFSKLVCFKAPYFASIKPVFTELEAGKASARIRKRRRVTNHLGTVHAIAMANLCEFVAGTLMEVSISRQMRWIPKGMTIEYLAKAETGISAHCELENYDWKEKQDVVVQVTVTDDQGKVVSRASVPMYVSPKPPRKAA